MQSNAARAAVAVVSIALVVVLFVVLSGGDDEEGATTTDAAQQTTTTAEDPSGSQADKPDKPQKPDKPEVPVIEVVGGEPKGGVAELTFEKGDEVRFDVESDIDEEVHVHGYDIGEELVAGKTTEIAFPADIDGVFEVELELSGVELAELTVNP